MAQVVIRNIDDAVIRRLKSRAARRGVSLERELRTILTEAARADRSGFAKRAAAFRQKLAGRRHSDSTALIRKTRGPQNILRPPKGSPGDLTSPQSLIAGGICSPRDGVAP